MFQIVVNSLYGESVTGTGFFGIAAYLEPVAFLQGMFVTGFR